MLLLSLLYLVSRSHIENIISLRNHKLYCSSLNQGSFQLYDILHVQPLSSLASHLYPTPQTPSACQENTLTFTTHYL